MTLPQYLKKLQNYRSTHRIPSQSEPYTQRTSLKLPLISFPKYDEDVYPRSLVLGSGWNPPLPPPCTPSPAITSRLDHRTGNARRTNWHIHRFPQRRGENTVWWTERGDKEERWKVLMIKKAFSARKGKYWNCNKYQELYLLLLPGASRYGHSRQDKNSRQKRWWMLRDM